MAATIEQQRQPLPTEENPELGAVRFEEVPITEAEHWVEDGLHVFRSTEFDVTAAAPDEWEAARKLLRNVEDYGQHLVAIGADELTVEEARVALTILERFLQGYRNAEARMQRESLPRRVGRLIGRRRSDHRAGFHRQSTPPTSSRLQHA